MQDTPQWCRTALAALREFWDNEIAHDAVPQLAGHWEEAVLARWSIGATPMIVLNDEDKRIESITSARPTLGGDLAIVVSGCGRNPDAIQLKAMNEHIVENVRQQCGSWPPPVERR